MDDDRRRVMAKVRAALARRPERAPMPEYADGAAIARSAPAGPRDAVVEAFVAAMARAGGRAFTDAGALGAWLLEHRLLRGYCDPAIAELASRLPPGLVVTTKLARERIDEVDFGMTRAAGAIAETGTIVLDDGTTSRRLGSLAPWAHVAVVPSAAIHRTVGEAIGALGGDPYVVWCTGPSKTADVEGILIQGVHGPGEQIALIV
jgi:L-lactate dehydrogenase complex protein LldG